MLPESYFDDDHIDDFDPQSDRGDFARPCEVEQLDEDPDHDALDGLFGVGRRPSVGE